MTLNNLGSNGAKLIASACAVAATAKLARDLALSASMIAAADTEVVRIVSLEQVEAATRAAAAAAPTSTAAARGGKRKGGVVGGTGEGRGGGGSEHAHSDNGYTNVQSALRPSE